MARILVVDDEANIRTMVRIALEKAGHTVEQAADGPEGIERFRDGADWDVVLLDQRMPGMEGLEVLREMRNRDPLARVVMIHHPPLRGGRMPILRGLDDFSAFEAVVAECGAELVLHGHTHRIMARRLPSAATRNAAGYAPVLGAPSVSAAAPDASHRACYYLIHLAREGGLWRTEWRARGLAMGGREIVEREAPRL